MTLKSAEHASELLLHSKYDTCVPMVFEQLILVPEWQHQHICFGHDGPTGGIALGRKCERYTSNQTVIENGQLCRFCSWSDVFAASTDLGIMGSSILLHPDRRATRDKD